MKAKNIHKAPINLVSGVCKPGGVAEFTSAEFMFLANMGRAEIAIDPPKKITPKKAAIKRAETSPDFS